jgi:hypothetical protein
MLCAASANRIGAPAVPLHGGNAAPRSEQKSGNQDEQRPVFAGQPAAAPDVAVRQPRVVPTASTIVSASTNSTSDAKKLGMAAESAALVIEE